MNIKLNNEELDFKLEDEKTMGAVLGEIEKQCQEKKQSVTEIKVDGKSLTAKELDNFFLKPVTEDCNLELFTIGGQDIKNMLEEIGKEFIHLAEELETIPVKMQSGEDEKVIKIIEDFSITLRELYTAAKFFDLADIAPDHKFGDKTLQEFQKEISEKLEMLINGFEEKDSIEVSDIAEYELSPIAKELGNELLCIA